MSRLDPRNLDLRRAGLVLAGLVLAGVAYRPLLEFQPQRSLEREIELLLFTTTETGPLVVLIMSGWLLYRRWAGIRSLPPEGSIPLAVALLLPALAIFAWATHSSSEDLLVPALMLNVLGFGALLWGRRSFRWLAMPVLMLVFAMGLPAPLLNEVLWRFQTWTADYTAFILWNLGMARFVAGDQILTAGQNYAIIEACSGLRSLETLAMLTLLMIDLFRRRGLHAVILLLLAPPIALALNGFRAVTLILNPHSEVVAVHTIQGVTILLVGVTLLYLADGLLARLIRSGKPPDAGSPQPPPSLGRVAAVCGGLAGLAVLSFAVPRWEPPGRTVLPFPDSQIPKSLEGWTSERIETDRQFLGIVRFRAWVDRRYERRNGEAVRLFAGVGGHDRRRSPFSPKTALPGSGWWVEREESAVLEPDSRRVRVSVVRFGSGARRKLVFDWREGTSGQLSETLRAAIALDHSVFAREREGVSIRMSTFLEGVEPAELAAARRRLERFYRIMRPRFDLLGFPRGHAAAD